MPGPERMGRSRDWDDPELMLGVDEARERVLSAFRPLEPVQKPLLDALGLVLAEDIVATVAIPPFRNSAMDGYAVRADDTSGASDRQPISLEVVATIPAGAGSTIPVGHGQAARIMTGAAMPEGADAVVRFEETDELARPGARERVLVHRAASRGENVRAAGEDIRCGATVLAAGTRLGPAELGVLASLNRGAILVHRPPTVAILSTGDEVVDLGPELLPGQIRNSNSYTLAALVREAGGVPLLLGVARDDVDDIRARLRSASGADLLITSGGVSLGDYDLVKDVLQAAGKIELWQVRIKPGKPMAFGQIGSTPLLGLPGNPVAAVVAFLQFGRPAIARMLGLSACRLPVVRARLSRGHENRGRRRHFVRGVVARHETGYVAMPCSAQGSGILSSVAQANCLIVLPEEWDYAPEGAMVEVELLDGAQLS